MPKSEPTQRSGILSTNLLAQFEDEDLQLATARLSLATRKTLDHEAIRYCDVVEKSLNCLADSEQKQYLLRSHLLGAIESAEVDLEAKSALRNTQLALGCPAMAGLRESTRIFTKIDRALHWPQITKTIDELIQVQKEPCLSPPPHNLANSSNTNDINQHQTSQNLFDLYDSFENRLLIFGASDKETVSLAYRTLELTQQGIGQGFDSTFFARIFEVLRLQKPIIKTDEAQVILEGFNRYKNLIEKSEGSQSFIDLRHCAQWIETQPQISRADKARIKHQWKSLRSLHIDHEIVQSSDDVELLVAINELLDELDATQTSTNSSYLQLKCLAPFLRTRLTELDHGDAEARMWARTYLRNAYRLVTGRELDKRQSISCLDLSQKSEINAPNQNALASIPSELDFEKCSDKEIQRRHLIFTESVKDICGQKAAKDRIKSHFDGLLKQQTQKPLYLFGPSRIGKSQLLSQAFRAYFPDLFVKTINCRAISSDLLQGSEQKWVGGAPGLVARAIMDAGIATDKAGKSRRKPVAIIFDDVDHSGHAEQRIIASALANEPLIDNFFGCEIQTSGIMMALCGNNEEISEHFRGRMSIFEMRMPHPLIRKEIIEKTVESFGKKISLSAAVTHYLAHDIVGRGPRLEPGVPGLIAETKRLLTQASKMHPDPTLPWEMSWADAVDFLADETGLHEFRTYWWESILKDSPGDDELRIHYSSDDGGKRAEQGHYHIVTQSLGDFCSENVRPYSVHRYLDKLIHPWRELSKKNSHGNNEANFYIATRGASGRRLFDETVVQPLFVLLELQCAYGIIGKKTDLRRTYCRLSCADNLPKGQHKELFSPMPHVGDDLFANASHLLLFWAQSRYKAMYGLSNKSEQLCILPILADKTPKEFDVPGLLSLDFFDSELYLLKCALSLDD